MGFTDLSKKLHIEHVNLVDLTKDMWCPETFIKAIGKYHYSSRIRWGRVESLNPRTTIVAGSARWHATFQPGTYKIDGGVGPQTNGPRSPKVLWTI